MQNLPKVEKKKKINIKRLRSLAESVKLILKQEEEYLKQNADNNSSRFSTSG